MVGGCHWIGASVPIDRQVWALVNQPVLNFSSLPSAGGYWLGSMVLPLLIAILAVPFVPRGRSIATDLAVVQWAWSAAAIALAWFPMLDVQDGHLSGWLIRHDLTPNLLWLAPGVAAAASLVPTLRLLELTRRRQIDLTRANRVIVVAVHLGGPAVVWIGLAYLVRGQLPIAAVLGLMFPLAASLLFAWFRYPHADVRRLVPPGPAVVIGLTAVALVGASALWFGGRPLGDGQRVGRIWAEPQAFNNIRPWIEVLPATSFSFKKPSVPAEIQSE